MKLIFFLLLFSPLNFILLNENLDSCNGIDNYIFGASKDSFKNMSLEFEEGNSQLYTLNSDAIKISGVQFDFIRITFIKNKLSAISLSTKGDTRAAFFKYLKDKYGAPIKNKNRFEWNGKLVKIVFEFYNNSKDAAVDFYKK